MRSSAMGVSLVLLAALSLAGCTGDKPQETTAAGSQVEMKDFAFKPTEITVKKGTKVTWRNRDSSFHTVTSDNGTTLDSPNVQSGQTFAYTFDAVGTFSYHCEPHPTMMGKVIVTA